MTKKVTVKETTKHVEEDPHDKGKTEKIVTVTTIDDGEPEKKAKPAAKKKASESEEEVKPKKRRKRPARKRRRSVAKEEGEDSEITSSTKRRLTAREREQLLIENFVGLQHAMTNMSIKFASLSDNIMGLLNVFEEAAKNFAAGGKSNDKDLLKKINSLLEQNKTIARGLVMMEGKLRGRGEGVGANFSSPPPMDSGFESSGGTSSGESIFDKPRPRPLPSS